LCPEGVTRRSIKRAFFDQLIKKRKFSPALRKRMFRCVRFLGGEKKTAHMAAEKKGMNPAVPTYALLAALGGENALDLGGTFLAYADGKEMESR